MRIMIFCNTYYQLIFAIQMRLTIMKNDEVDIIISDRSKGAQLITERLQNEKVFDNCYYVEIKSFGKVYSVTDGITGKCCFGFLRCKYDQLCIHNIDITSYALFSRLNKYNSRIIVNRFEEGILSYDRKGMDSIDKKKRLVRIVRKCLGRPLLEDVIDKFYCYYPYIYNGNLSTIEVPKIQSRDTIIPILRRIFNLTELDYIEYKRRYIFFTSVYDFEGDNEIGEFSLLLKLADLVGRENLIVKVHPRDTRTIYEENGLKVDKNSAAPWEAIQLCGDFKKNVFLTTASSSVLSGSLMLQYSIPTFFLYKLCNIEKNGIAQKAIFDIEKTLSNEKMKKTFSNIITAEQLEEVFAKQL